MATAPSFWAAGGSKIKSAESPNPKIAEAPPKAKPDPQQKKGLVLKGMTNGQSTNSVSNGTYPKTPIGKKTNWADEDDDDNTFIAEFMSQDPKIATLETTIALKEERVKELDALVETKTLRIAELEGAVQDKDVHISDLETEVQKKGLEIEKLKKVNSDQLAHNQEFLRETEEKDHQIKYLKAELEEKASAIGDLEREKKAATISNLEQESAALVPVPTNDEVTPEDEPKNVVSESIKSNGTDVVTEAKTKAKKTASVASDSDSFEIVDAPVTEEAKDEKPATVVTKQSEETGTTKNASGPSLVTSTFPNFVTKETLKVVPPVPKPKTMTFGIDMSKYGKKPVASAAAKIPAPSSPATELNGHTTPWGHSSRQARDKAGTMPELNPAADIRHMSHGQRVVFGNGPEVIVKLGEVKLASIPKYVLMQCSGKAYKYFTANPDATSWVLPADSMDADAATAHLKWMDEMTYQSRVYSVRLQTETVYDKKNLHICRAARVLGLNNTYVAQFTKQFCDRIRAQDVSFEFMDLLCQLAYPENDPVFDCMVHNLVNQKKVGNAKGAADLEKLMAKHQFLKEKVEKIEKRIGGRPRKTWNSPEGSARGGSNDRSGSKGGNRGKSAPRNPPVAPAPGNKPVTPAPGDALFTTLH
ncbi:uncharacterized protein J4E84_004601 [Alternaria hordeiaustralica]|uniref:uncharacterized protein n=1 Tax=Alternaria hordeiaustralica TaxID=1187925 RepID=UPI0020C31DEB|nr:uncharacterized protein J4E84_004601 [Alternaria hordeiaustralica]KAI4688671.1 hypothetical protein J4E84_004601 [Alternaria hordeiaustralica]